MSEYLKTKDLYRSGLYASAACSILTEKTGELLSQECLQMRWLEKE